MSGLRAMRLVEAMVEGGEGAYLAELNRQEAEDEAAEAADKAAMEARRAARRAAREAAVCEAKNAALQRPPMNAECPHKRRHTDVHDAAMCLVWRSTTAVGLPFHVEDPVILARVAELFRRPR